MTKTLVKQLIGNNYDTTKKNIEETKKNYLAQPEEERDEDNKR